MWHFWHSVGVFFGVYDEAGPGYGFFSGVGSDLGEIAIFSAIIGMYRKHNCHTQGCWRIAHYPYVIDGAEYRLCRLHHPTATKIEHHHILAHHRQKLDSQSQID